MFTMGKKLFRQSVIVENGNREPACGRIFFPTTAVGPFCFGGETLPADFDGKKWKPKASLRENVRSCHNRRTTCKEFGNLGASIGEGKNRITRQRLRD